NETVVLGKERIAWFLSTRLFEGGETGFEQRALQAPYTRIVDRMGRGGFGDFFGMLQSAFNEISVARQGKAVENVDMDWIEKASVPRMIRGGPLGTPGKKHRKRVG